MEFFIFPVTSGLVVYWDLRANTIQLWMVEVNPKVGSWNAVGIVLD